MLGDATVQFLNTSLLHCSHVHEISIGFQDYVLDDNPNSLLHFLGVDAVSMDIARDQYLKREASSMLLRHFKGPAARKVYGGLLSKDTFAATIQNAFRARLARRRARQKRAGKRGVAHRRTFP